MTASGWPSLSSANDDSKNPPIRWETVKTEEEEYLDKLREDVMLSVHMVAITRLSFCA